MNTGSAGISEQGHEGGFAFVLFVLRDAAVMHRVSKPETFEHLRLRQSKTDTDLQEFFSESHGTRTRVAHQKLPPDEIRRPLLAVGSVLRSPLSFAVSMNLSCSTVMLITR